MEIAIIVDGIISWKVREFGSQICYGNPDVDVTRTLRVKGHTSHCHCLCQGNDASSAACVMIERGFQLCECPIYFIFNEIGIQDHENSQYSCTVHV